MHSMLESSTLFYDYRLRLGWALCYKPNNGPEIDNQLPIQVIFQTKLSVLQDVNLQKVSKSRGQEFLVHEMELGGTKV